MQRTESFGELLTDVMRRRYIAAIDIARELGVSQAQVGRWIRGEAFPAPDDAALLARLLDGQDGERLAQAATRHPSQAATIDSPPATPRPLDASERIALLGLPAVFRDAFGSAIGR